MNEADGQILLYYTYIYTSAYSINTCCLGLKVCDLSCRSEPFFPTSFNLSAYIKIDKAINIGLVKAFVSPENSALNHTVLILLMLLSLIDCLMLHRHNFEGIDSKLSPHVHRP